MLIANVFREEITTCDIVNNGLRISITENYFMEGTLSLQRTINRYTSALVENYILRGSCDFNPVNENKKDFNTFLYEISIK